MRITARSGRLNTSGCYALLLAIATSILLIYGFIIPLLQKREYRKPIRDVPGHSVIEQPVEAFINTNRSQLPHWKATYWCDINCTTGVPCEYKDEVDLRILLLVADRSESLVKSFQKVSEIDMMGDRLSVDVWIDMLPDGNIHEKTREMADTLTKQFTNGRACYHIQDHHAYVATQWVDTYRPKLNTREAAIILEDDIDLSKYVWRWLKALHSHFRNADFIAGYTFKSENKLLRSMKHRKQPIKGPKFDTIVLYNCFETWGYSPQPNVWRDFQDWYHTVRRDKSPDDKKNKIDLIDPSVNGTVHSSWWKFFKKVNFQESMAHEIFNLYYVNIVNHGKLFTVYHNLNVFTGKDIRLCSNRNEPGLHYALKDTTNTSELLLNYWDDDFIRFPEHPKRISIKGNTV